MTSQREFDLREKTGGTKEQGREALMIQGWRDLTEDILQYMTYPQCFWEIFADERSNTVGVNLVLESSSKLIRVRRYILFLEKVAAENLYIKPSVDTVLPDYKEYSFEDIPYDLFITFAFCEVFSRFKDFIAASQSQVSNRTIYFQKAVEKLRIVLQKSVNEESFSTLIEELKHAENKNA